MIASKKMVSGNSAVSEGGLVGSACSRTEVCVQRLTRGQAACLGSFAERTCPVQRGTAMLQQDVIMGGARLARIRGQRPACREASVHDKMCANASFHARAAAGMCGA